MLAVVVLTSVSAVRYIEILTGRKCECFEKTWYASTGAKVVGRFALRQGSGVGAMSSALAKPRASSTECEGQCVFKVKEFMAGAKNTWNKFWGKR